MDSVEFGRQVADLSIGRVGYEDAWHLTVPTLGQTNVAQPYGDPSVVKINEWLASAQATSAGSFIELYNPGVVPVDLGGMYLTDGAAALPVDSRVQPLSFMAANGYLVFQADGSSGPGRVGFRLSTAGGTIRLFDAQSNEVDKVVYGVQTADVSEGRTPDGAGEIEYFPVPTPGAANPGGRTIVTTDLTLLEERADKRVLVPTGTISDDWKGGKSFDDSAWMSCKGAPGGVGYEKGTGYQSLITLDVGAQMYGSGKNNTCYIRVPFTVEASTLAEISGLTLKVRDDDGFVAYLNGKEVVQRNFTGTPAWNSHADSAIESNVQDVDESIDLSAFTGDLKAGANILAIHGMNSGSTSSDFLITVALEAVLAKVQSQ
ncbi:MAG: lamin tail domain-containing protein [Phycisphaerae bacterium]|nr:lamin tail domain-containing protein [Phycisphaerae bacterium]